MKKETLSAVVVFTTASLIKIWAAQKVLKKTGLPYNKSAAANFIIENSKYK